MATAFKKNSKRVCFGLGPSGIFYQNKTFIFKRISEFHFLYAQPKKREEMTGQKRAGKRSASM